MIIRKEPQSITVALVLAATMLLVLPILILYPFHSDIDIQQVMGFALLRDHRLPYIGSWDSNFPGAVWLHALAMALFGRSELGLRFFDYLLQCGVTLALYHFGRYWLPRGPASLGAVLYALFYISGPGQYISQRDCLAILPLLLGAGFALKASRSTRSTNLWMIASGALIGFGFWIRPTYALLAAVAPFTLFDLRNGRGRAATASETIGFLFAIALGLLPYGFSLAAVKEMYLATIQYNAEIYSHIYNFHDYSRRAWVAVAFIAAWAFTLWWHKPQGAQFELKHRDTREFRFIFGYLFALLLGVAIMQRLASYHFAPFFAMMMPVVAAVLWDLFVMRVRSRAILAVTALAVVAALFPWGLIRTTIATGLDTQSTAETRAAIAYLERHSSPNDALEVASFFPVIRWRIDRPFVTRFTTPQPLFTMPPEGTPKPYQKQWQAEYVRVIDSVRPKFVVVENHEDVAGHSTLKAFMLMSGFAEVMNRDYRADTVIGSYYLFARR